MKVRIQEWPFFNKRSYGIGSHSNWSASWKKGTNSLILWPLFRCKGDHLLWTFSVPEGSAGAWTLIWYPYQNYSWINLLERHFLDFWSVTWINFQGEGSASWILLSFILFGLQDTVGYMFENMLLPPRFISERLFCNQVSLWTALLLWKSWQQRYLRHLFNSRCNSKLWSPHLQASLKLIRMLVWWFGWQCDGRGISFMIGGPDSEFIAAGGDQLFNFFVPDAELERLEICKINFGCHAWSSRGWFFDHDWLGIEKTSNTIYYPLLVDA